MRPWEELPPEEDTAPFTYPQSFAFPLNKYQSDMLLQGGPREVDRYYPEKGIENLLLESLLRRGVDPSDTSNVLKEYALEMNLPKRSFIASGLPEPYQSNPLKSGLTRSTPHTTRMNFREGMPIPSELSTIRHELQHAEDYNQKMSSPWHHSKYEEFDTQYPIEEMLREAKVRNEPINPSWLQFLPGYKFEEQTQPFIPEQRQQILP